MTNEEIIIELLEPKPSNDEKEYITKALRAGVQSTEILHVLTSTRLTRYNQRMLLGAMENPEFTVYPVLVTEIQTLYTIIKGMIQVVWRENMNLRM